MFGRKTIHALEAKSTDLERRWAETLNELNRVRRERDEARAQLAKPRPSTQVQHKAREAQKARVLAELEAVRGQP